jgi:hypothetical protein
MSNRYKAGPYNEICYHVLDSLSPSKHTLLCNPVGSRQFCALHSECLALWQLRQLNTSVRHTSSVVDMPGAQVTTCQHLSCKCWKPCTVSVCFDGITHTPYAFTNRHGTFTGATHNTQKSKHTSYFKVCHGSGRPSTFNDIFTLSTHSCTMAQSTCANYMLQSTVQLYYFMSDMLLPYFLKLPRVPVRGRKLKIWYKEHIHNREYNRDE